MYIILYLVLTMIFISFSIGIRITHVRGDSLSRESEEKWLTNKTVCLWEDRKIYQRRSSDRVRGASIVAAATCMWRACVTYGKTCLDWNQTYWLFWSVWWTLAMMYMYNNLIASQRHSTSRQSALWVSCNWKGDRIISNVLTHSLDLFQLCPLKRCYSGSTSVLRHSLSCPFCIAIHSNWLQRHTYSTYNHESSNHDHSRKARGPPIDFCFQVRKLYTSCTVHYNNGNIVSLCLFSQRPTRSQLVIMFMLYNKQYAVIFPPPDERGSWELHFADCCGVVF